MNVSNVVLNFKTSVAMKQTLCAEMFITDGVKINLNSYEYKDMKVSNGVNSFFKYSNETNLV